MSFTVGLAIVRQSSSPLPPSGIIDHKLDIQGSHGQNASLYLGVCSCGWVSGDGRDEETIREQHRKHVAGEVPPWRMQPGDTPGWDERHAGEQLDFRAQKSPPAPGGSDGL